LTILEKRQNLHLKTELVKRKNLELTRQLEQMEQLSMVGRAWAMVAHEINNLLAPLTSYAQIALTDPQDQEMVQKALKKAIKLGNQASEILQQVPVLAGEQATSKTPYSVRQLVEDAFSSIGRDFKKDKIRVQKDIRRDLMVSVDPVGIRQVLMNLILNAREAMLPDGGKLTITVCATEGGVQIRISDTGCGMPPEQIEHIFEPFYTTKDGQQGRRKGHGVGLSFCKRVLENHGAAIRVQSKPMEGTVFTINLPQAS